ncbi:MAG: hypothetical protein KAW00_05155 [Dehalococcoidia bacterium]|nr:hypothetical protein [Dehalococcoidia bacterium]
MRRITWLGVIFGILIILSLFLPQSRPVAGFPDYGYIDPNGDGTIGSGGTYANVDDAVRQPDTDIITSDYNTFSSDKVDFYLMSTISGVGSVSQIVVWAYYVNSGANNSFDVGLYAADEMIQYGTTQRLPNQSSASWNSVSFTGLNLSQAELDDLRVKFVNTHITAKPYNSELYAFYAKVTYTPTIISITVTDGTVAYGTVAVGATEDTTASGVNDTQTATNNGNVAEKFQIKSSNAIGATDWTLGSSQGDNTFTHKASIDGGNNWSIAMEVAGTYYELVASVPVDGSQTFDLQIGMPTSITDYGEHTITVTVLATAA